MRAAGPVSNPCIRVSIRVVRLA